MSNCVNLNHTKMNVLVRFCSLCGEIVNRKIQTRNCSESTHSERKKGGSKFCIDCGKKLVK